MKNFHPERVQEKLAPLRGMVNVFLLSGGLSFAATTGYYLTALQAEAGSPGFSPAPHSGTDLKGALGQQANRFN